MRGMTYQSTAEHAGDCSRRSKDSCAEHQLSTRVEPCQDNEVGRHETSFGDSKSDTDTYQLAEVADEGGQCGNNAKGDDDGRNPNSGADFAKYKIGGNFDGGVEDVEDG